jgi:hypothetical protein
MKPKFPIHGGRVHGQLGQSPQDFEEWSYSDGMFLDIFELPGESSCLRIVSQHELGIGVDLGLAPSQLRAITGCPGPPEDFPGQARFQ